MTTLKTKYSPHCKVCIHGMYMLLTLCRQWWKSWGFFFSPCFRLIFCSQPLFIAVCAFLKTPSLEFWFVHFLSLCCFSPPHECNPICLLSCLNRALAADNFTICSVSWLRIWSPQSTIQSWCQPLVTINPLIYLSLLWIAVYNSLFLLWGNTATVNKGETGGPLWCSSLFPVTFLETQMHVFISAISVMILVPREAHSAWEMGNIVFHSWLHCGCWIKHRKFLKIPLASSGKCFEMSSWKLPPKN